VCPVQGQGCPLSDTVRTTVHVATPVVDHVGIGPIETSACGRCMATTPVARDLCDAPILGSAGLGDERVRRVYPIRSRSRQHSGFLVVGQIESPRAETVPSFRIERTVVGMVTLRSSGTRSVFTKSNAMMPTPVLPLTLRQD